MRFFEAIGIVICVLWILGALGLIDFLLCARPIGQCTCAIWNGGQV